MTMSAVKAKLCVAWFVRCAKFCWRNLGGFLGVVKTVLGDCRRRGMEIAQSTVRRMSTMLEVIKRGWSGTGSSRKLDEGVSGSVSKEDVVKMTELLRFIAEGGLYGGLFAILSISIASFYAGWVGMAVVLLALAGLIFRFGRRKLDSILGLGEKKRGISWERGLLNVGLFLLVVALMGLVDRVVGNIIPKPIPSSSLVIAIEGVIGFVLLVIAIWLFGVKGKRQ
jgi:hypothetical protein